MKKSKKQQFPSVQTFFAFSTGNIEFIHRNIFILSSHGLSAEYLRSIPVDIFNIYIKLYNKEKIAEDEMLRQKQDQQQSPNHDPVLLNQATQ